MTPSIAGKAWLLLALPLWVGFPALGGTIEGRVRTSGSETGLSNCVISVEDIEGPFAEPKEPAVMDQKGLRFVPHVLAILVGTTVEFPNSDPVSHNVFSISDVKRFNLGMYPRGTIHRIKFEQAGVVELLCNVHIEMSAYIVVLKNPYFARTEPDGTYRIEGVPAGKHRLRCWHERFPAQERTAEVPETGSVTVDFSMSK